MTTPIETAAETLWFAWGCEGTVSDHSYPARRAVESIAREHRDDIAREIEKGRGNPHLAADYVLAYLTATS